MTRKTQTETPGSDPPCRFCGEPLRYVFTDLGMSPLCESYVSPENANRMEPFYPLRVWVCRACFLVQLEEYVPAEEIFSEYAYFSSFSDSWLAHARAYTDMALRRFGLNAGSHVVEIASNDGYLLQYFVERGIPVLGIEPAGNVARTAVGKGVPTLVRFFGEALANELSANGKGADLLIGNNVLAQVPNLNDFLRGMKLLLKPDGVVTMEFPHLLRLVEGNQFDTIYHEHFSYFSFSTVQRIFSDHGFGIFDVEEIPTHGGSLRIYARHAGNGLSPVASSVRALADREESLGMNGLPYYLRFQERVMETKRKILEFLIAVRRKGERVAGYGAPGKGNTLLNYCGIRTDFLEYTVDRNPYKQGKLLPGSRIPIHAPERIRETRPDYVMILPWNFKEEIMEQLQYIREWGGAFVVPIPELTVYP